jgi:hypothetical protein
MGADDGRRPGHSNGRGYPAPLRASFPSWFLVDWAVPHRMAALLNCCKARRCVRGPQRLAAAVHICQPLTAALQVGSGAWQEELLCPPSQGDKPDASDPHVKPVGQSGWPGGTKPSAREIDTVEGRPPPAVATVT